MMKKEEKMAQKNIELSAEFSRYLFEHDEIEAKLPKDAEIVLLPDFDAELRSYNSAMGKEMEARGEKVCYVRVGALRPRAMSRLEAVAVGV
jgi:hypothetical protein